MKRDAGRGVPPQTLPDLLRDGLDVVFVGINPGLYSAAQGHYFARRTNRFWPAFSCSTLSREARRGLGLAMLGPAHDAALLIYGFGFTDVVKRPTGNAGELAPGELTAGAPLLLEKLARHRPLVACFHGLTGYRPFARAVFPTMSACRRSAFSRATSAEPGSSSCPIRARRTLISRRPIRPAGTTSWPRSWPRARAVSDQRKL
jgi:double-stranded uracil-DNA glycosylase